MVKGRPRKVAAGVIVTFLCSREDYLLLRELAQRSGRTLSDLLREAVERYLREAAPPLEADAVEVRRRAE